MQPPDLTAAAAQALAADFNRATQAHGAGRLVEAAALYTDILARVPGHAGALHLLGVCHFQQGRFAEGVPLVEKALALKPDYAEAHNNLGNGLKALGRLDEAMDCYRRALELRPGFADVRNNLGVALVEAGRPAEALDHFEQALALMPQRADALNNLGTALARLGRHDEAVAALEKAVALQPRYAEAHNNLGGALREQRRHAEALAAFERAIAIRPDYVDALYNRGNGLAALHRQEEALASYDRVLALDPKHALALNNRGIVLQALRRPEEAVASLDRAIALESARAEPWCNRANAYRDMHRFEAALADYARAVAARGDYPEAVFNRSVLHLLRGDYAVGWREYEERWRFEKFIAGSAGPLPASVIARFCLRPTRADLAGKRVVVAGEQGVGDQVMFASLLGELAGDAASVTLLSAGKLARLFARSFPSVRVHDAALPADDLLADDDVVVAIGSLAHAYRQSAADFPGAPYLHPAPEKVAAWRARLEAAFAGEARPLIGLSWRGGTIETRGAGRSLSLEGLLPILRGLGARFVSLQYGDVAEEVAAFNARHGQNVLCLPREEIEDFDDLAALVAATDHVLSVQTALIHLCGALGHPCLTMVPRQPEWRYGVSGETMPWYSSVRLLRQGEDGDWTPVITRAEAALAAALAGR